MRTLAEGEAPVEGSEVTITFTGKVKKVHGSLFTAVNKQGHEMFFTYTSGRTESVIREITPAPPVWITGAMYCHSVGSNDCYYLRLENGWKSVSSGEVFFDGSRWLSGEFLRKLKIMEVKK